MRGGLDRLQKEMDALTYNSRSVLNALIRSAVSSSSSKGFTVNRAGVDILLTRIDIYRLYKFYYEWEETGYDQTKFDSIIIAQDQIPVIDDNGTPINTSTTDALIKHSKMLYLTGDTLTYTSNDYWLGRVKTASNPKLVSNTAPIPLNLRTPIFDENMATTSYSQHETYLFPYSYYSVDLLGYSHDGIDHTLDGKSWTITADEYISIESDAIALGGVNTSDKRKTKARRNHDTNSSGTGIETTYSTAFGYSTQARAKYSTAGGLQSLVPRYADSAVAIGDKLLASEKYAGAVAGTVNRSAGIASGIFGGTYNIISGKYGGILGGVGNTVGGQPDTFAFPASDSNISSCIILNEAECLTGTEFSGSVIGRNQITITGNVVYRYSIDDQVALLSFTTYLENTSKIDYWGLNGDAFNTQYLKVTSVEYLNPSVYPTNVNKGKTILTLSGDVKGNGIIDGGIVSKVTTNKGVELGFASVALNLSNVASGYAQTVVGKYNYVNQDVLFIVGNGKNSYIEARSNAVEVRENGTSIYGTIHNQYNPTNYLSVELGVNSEGIEAYAYGSSMMVAKGDAHLMVNNYVGFFASTDNYINIEIASSDNPMLLRSGNYIDYRAVGIGKEDIAILSSRRLVTESIQDTVVRSLNSYISLESYTDMKFSWGNYLLLNGDTFGALPTDDVQMSHRVNGSAYISAFTFNDATNYSSGILNSGFYDISDPALSGTTFDGFRTITEYDPTISHYITTRKGTARDLDSYQILNIGARDANSSNYIDGYHAWQLNFPYMRDDNSELLPISVTMNELTPSGTLVSKSNRKPRFLAYRDEIDVIGTSGYVYTKDLISSIEFMISGTKYVITDPTSIASIMYTATPATSGYVDYYKMRNIVIMKLRMRMADLAGAGLPANGGSGGNRTVADINYFDIVLKTETANKIFGVSTYPVYSAINTMPSISTTNSASNTVSNVYAIHGMYTLNTATPRRAIRITTTNATFGSSTGGSFNSGDVDKFLHFDLTYKIYGN